MERVRIKICGITRPEDAISAAQAGVDAIGLVFYEKSPRRVDAVTATAIIKSLPPFICKVGLFVDADADTVMATVREVPLDLLQFHGSETPEYCCGFGKPYLKAVRMRAGVDIREFEKNYHDAAALLLDTHVVDIAGGTGQTFAWDLIPMGLRKPIILAGGLDAGNVGKAIRQVHPYAVDVSGGVESAKGIKDRRKIAAFVQAVGNASLPD
ncbi:MAG: N-(5'-phosphoribosyl)anthranilate isomerase [Gammaproteobacteria bacterium]|nr:N-(5'-phosphoribosyl)anthranilate isomerase [Gammaproteobacteria bacterium]